MSAQPVKPEPMTVTAPHACVGASVGRRDGAVVGETLGRRVGRATRVDASTRRDETRRAAWRRRGAWTPRDARALEPAAREDAPPHDERRVSAEWFEKLRLDPVEERSCTADPCAACGL